MRIRPLLAACCAAAVAWPCGAAAEGGGSRTWLATNDSRLEEMRGGFGLLPGLNVSFGITRSVEINGQMVSTGGFQINNLRSIDLATAEHLARQMASVNLVQNGPGNVLLTEMGPGIPALVVQNTLNNQKIRTVTEINAASNAMNLLKGMNLTRTLNDAIGAGTRR
jgi:hypothetical protein